MLFAQCYFAQCYLHNVIYTMLFAQCYLHNVIYTMLFTQCYLHNVILHNVIYTILFAQCYFAQYYIQRDISNSSRTVVIWLWVGCGLVVVWL